MKIHFVNSRALFFQKDGRSYDVLGFCKHDIYFQSRRPRQPSYCHHKPIITPGPFPPTLPSLDSDDSFVSYHYESTGTGWWSDDPENITIGLLTGVEEQTTHFKTNGTSVASSQSASGNFQFTTWYCMFPPTYYSNYSTCVSSNDASCSASQHYWFTGPAEVAWETVRHLTVL